MSQLVDNLIQLPQLFYIQHNITSPLNFGRTEILDAPSYKLEDDLTPFCPIHNIPEILKIILGNTGTWKCPKCKGYE